VDVVVSELTALVALIGSMHCFSLLAVWSRDHYGRTGATSLELLGSAPHPPDVLGGETGQVAASGWPGECQGLDHVLMHLALPWPQDCLLW